MRHPLAVVAILVLAACGSDLSGLKSEEDYPYRVNLIFELESDTQVDCLQTAQPCNVRLKGNVTNRHGTRIAGAQIFARTAQQGSFTPLVRANLSGIFNHTVVLERGATGRSITLCAGETVEVAITGQCPTVTLP